MNTKTICEYLKCTVSQLQQLQKTLGIKGAGVGHHNNFSKLEIARLKAGIYYKDYHFVPDTDRPWIFYAISETNEIKIEL